MTYRDLFDLKYGSLFTYKGHAAKKIWSAYSREKVANGDRDAKPPTGDVYAEDFCVFFEHKGSKEGVTVVFKFPDIQIPESEGYGSVNLQRFTPEYDALSNSFF